MNQTVVLSASARLLAPLMFLFSAYLLLRGHNAVGGGFIGGLVAGAGVVIMRLAHGPDPGRLLRRVSVELLVGAGLLVGVAYGLAGLVLGGALLQGAKLEIEVPLIGDHGLAASLIFDVGVYLIVVGLIVAAVRMLADEPSAPEREGGGRA
ncbi:hypothetical protein BH23ACT8_BH23ACT8_11400 [soil metagenome]